MLSFLKRKYRMFVNDNKFSEILTGSIYSVAAQVTSVGLTMIVNIIIARIYGAQALGILAMVTSFMLFITTFTVMGTNISILRLIPEHVAKHSTTSAFRVYRKTQQFVAVVALIIGITFIFASGIIAKKIFSKPHLSFYFALAAGCVIFKSLMDLNTSAVRGLRLIRTYAIMLVMPSVSMLTILIAMTLLFRRPSNPVFAQLAAYGLTGVLGVWIMNRTFKSKMQPSDTVASMSAPEVLSISMPMLMTAFMTYFVGQAGVIMVGMFRPESEVGYYSVAVKLSSLTAFILVAINSIAAPKFSELFHTGRMTELFRIAKKSTKLIFWTTIPILLILIFFGKFILGLLFGQNFTIAYPALLVLVIAQFVNSISGATGNFLNMTGHQKALSVMMMCAAGMNIILGVALIPTYGFYGAAVGGMVSICFVNISTVVYIKKKFGNTIGYIPVVSNFTVL